MPTASKKHARPSPVISLSAERRTRLRLRELCEEVLASYRVASARDLWTDAERREARTLLERCTPRLSA